MSSFPFSNCLQVCATLENFCQRNSSRNTNRAHEIVDSVTNQQTHSTIAQATTQQRGTQTYEIQEHSVTFSDNTDTPENTESNSETNSEFHGDLQFSSSFSEIRQTEEYIDEYLDLTEYMRSGDSDSVKVNVESGC